jgi:hypothetical protein
MASSIFVDLVEAVPCLLGAVDTGVGDKSEEGLCVDIGG